MTTSSSKRVVTEPTVRLQYRDECLIGVWLSFSEPEGIAVAELVAFSDFNHHAIPPRGWYWYRDADERDRGVQQDVYLLLVPTNDDLLAELQGQDSNVKRAALSGAGVDDVGIRVALVSAMGRKVDAAALGQFALDVWRSARASTG